MYYNKQFNCTFYDFYTILDKASKMALDKCLQYLLVDMDSNTINFKSVDVKNIFRHHIIFEICETIVKSNDNGRKIIYVHDEFDLSQTYICQIMDINGKLWQMLVKKILVDIEKYLPIMILKLRYPYKKFVQLLETTKTGEAIETQNTALGIINNYDLSTYNFGKIRNYALHHNLNFLSKTYFNQLSTKKLFYTY